MVAGLDVVILCGGRGTRAYPSTLDVPKPLLTVAGLPIVEHVMDIYASQGHRRFVLAAGYRRELLEERYRAGAPDPAPDRPTVVRVLDTGEDTPTGERLRRAAAATVGDTFFATYADGLGNVDLTVLLAAHRRSGALMTVTTVPLPSQYGTLVTDDSGRVVEFREKPRLDDHWINAGFFVLDRAALGYWQGTDLETEVLPAMATTGGLYAFRHRGFWKSMDTYKDRQELETLALRGDVPWRHRAAARASART